MLMGVLSTKQRIKLNQLYAEDKVSLLHKMPNKTRNCLAAPTHPKEPATPRSGPLSHLAPQCDLCMICRKKYSIDLRSD